MQTMHMERQHVRQRERAGLRVGTLLGSAQATKHKDKNFSDGESNPFHALPCPTFTTLHDPAFTKLLYPTLHLRPPSFLVSMQSLTWLHSLTWLLVARIALTKMAALTHMAAFIHTGALTHMAASRSYCTTFAFRVAPISMQKALRILAV